MWRFLNKRGEISIETILKLGLALLLLIIGMSIIIVLISGKGGAALDQIKNILRFGR